MNMQSLTPRDIKRGCSKKKVVDTRRLKPMRAGNILRSQINRHSGECLTNKISGKESSFDRNLVMLRLFAEWE